MTRLCSGEVFFFPLTYTGVGKGRRWNASGLCLRVFLVVLSVQVPSTYKMSN